jgi:hypothetical protein
MLCWDIVPREIIAANYRIFRRKSQQCLLNLKRLRPQFGMKTVEKN